MKRSGTARRRRHAMLAEMVDAATRAGDPASPWRRTPRVWEFFEDESDVLRTLHAEWWTALAGAVYVAIDRGRGDLARDVLGALSVVTQRHLGVRRILEAHASHPAIAHAMRKEQALLSGFLPAQPERLRAA